MLLYYIIMMGEKGYCLETNSLGVLWKFVSKQTNRIRLLRTVSNPG